MPTPKEEEEKKAILPFLFFFSFFLLLVVSFSVAIANESKVQLQDPLVKYGSEPPFVTMLPLPLDHAEGDLLVWWTGNELQDACGAIARLRVFFELESGRSALVNKMGVKNLWKENQCLFACLFVSGERTITFWLSH